MGGREGGKGSEVGGWVGLRCFSGSFWNAVCR